MIGLPQFNVSSNAQTIAAQQMMASQNKQAQLFKGGAGVQAPNMGGDDQAQANANKLAGAMTNLSSQSINDQRFKGGMVKKSRRKRKNSSSKRRKRRVYKSRKNRR